MVIRINLGPIPIRYRPFSLMIDESSFGTACSEIINSRIAEKTAILPILTRKNRENLYV